MSIGVACSRRARILALTLAGAMLASCVGPHGGGRSERVAGEVPAWWKGAGADERALYFRGVGDGKTPGEALRKAREAARREAVAVLRGARVDSRYDEAVRLAGGKVQEHVKTYLKVVVEGYLGATAPMREATVTVEHVDAHMTILDTTHRGFVLLEVPRDELRPSVARYERTAQALEEQGDADGAIHFWRLADRKHRQEDGSPDPRHLRKILALCREASRPGEVLDAARELMPLEADPSARGRIQEEIARLERVLAGGEFAFQRQRATRILKTAARALPAAGSSDAAGSSLSSVTSSTSGAARDAPGAPRGIRLERIAGLVTPGGILSYTVLCSTPAEYVAVWIDDAEIGIYPTLLEHWGQAVATRSSGDDPAAPVIITEDVLDRKIGPVEGPHVLAILAFPGGAPDWAPRGVLRFPRHAVEKERARPGRESPAASLAGMIGRIESALQSGEAVCDVLEFTVRG